MASATLVFIVTVGCGLFAGGGETTDATIPALPSAPTEPEQFGPTQSCIDYVACAEAAGVKDFELVEAAYGPGAACWLDPAEALACSSFCQEALDLVRTEDPAVSGCWGSAPPATALLFSAVGDEWVSVGVSGDKYCDLWFDFDSGAALEFVGDDVTPEFEVYIYHPVLPSDPLIGLACTLELDRTFECDGGFDLFEGEGVPTGSGSFAADFDRLTFSVDIPKAFVCELTAEPE